MKTRDLTLCVQWNTVDLWIPHEMEQSRHVFILALGNVLLAHDLSNCLPVGDASTLIANCTLWIWPLGVRLPPAWLDLTVPWGMQSTSQIPSPRTCSFQAPHLSLNPPPSSWLRFTISRLSIQRALGGMAPGAACLWLTLICHALLLHGLREQGVRLLITWVNARLTRQGAKCVNG